MNKYDDLTGVTAEDLIRRYVSDAIDYGSKTRCPSAVASNAAATRMGAVYCELRRRGRDAQESLVALLNHPNDDVRGWAQAHVVDFAPERVVPMLEDQVARGGVEAWGARRTLQELKEGTRRPTPEFLYRSQPTVAESERWPPVSSEVASLLSAVGNRLDAEVPDLGRAFREASLDKRRLVAVDAVQTVVGETALSGETTDGGIDEVEDALYALQFEKLPALAGHQRMTALESRLRAQLARVEDDPNRVGVAEGLRWSVHAATALATALLGDSARLDEVIHEAIAAHNQPEVLIPYLVKTLREK